MREGVAVGVCGARDKRVAGSYCGASSSASRGANTALLPSPMAVALRVIDDAVEASSGSSHGVTYVSF